MADSRPKDYSSKYDNYDIGQRLADLRSMVEVQLDCTTPDDDYMRGMANGLLLAWHIMREPYGTEVPYLCPPLMEPPEVSP